MQGSVIIDFNVGWACSNEATFMLDRKLIRGEKNERLSKHTETIRILSYLAIDMQLENGLEGEAVFKMDDSGTQKGFKIKLVGLTEEMAILEVLQHIEDTKLITKKIKGGYNYGK